MKTLNISLLLFTVISGIMLNNDAFASQSPKDSIPVEISVEMRESIEQASLFFPVSVIPDNDKDAAIKEVLSLKEVTSPYRTPDFEIRIADRSLNKPAEFEQLSVNLETVDSIMGVAYNNSSTRTDASNFSDETYVKRLNKIPTLINLSYNNHVRYFIDLFTKEKRPATEKLLGLSKAYYPEFEKVLDQYKLPLELKYIPFISSTFNQDAVSWNGASGMWQLAYTTAKMYKLNVNSYVDERRDIKKSTAAAAEFLRDMFDIYKDWTLALTAYISGPASVNKAIARAGGSRDYWDLYEYLPAESRGFVPAFLAAAYVSNFYTAHKLTPANVKLPGATREFVVKEKVHLGQIAQVLNINENELRYLNASYKNEIVPGASSACKIKLPRQKAKQFTAMKDSISNYKTEEFFKPRRQLAKPPVYQASSSKKYNVPTSISGKKKIYYTVKSGDVPGSIAKQFGVNVSSLQSWNNIHSRISIGQKLVIFVDQSSSQHTQVVTASQTTTQATNNSPVSKTTTADAHNYVLYQIKSGDNLWTIAQRYPGVSSSDIMRLNKFTSQHLSKLKPGEMIKIKRL